MDDLEAEFNIFPSGLNVDSSGSSEDERIPRKIKSPILLHASPASARSKESGFHKSSRLCLKAIRDAMLRHHWQEAAQYLSAYSQTLEETTVSKQSVACEIIWRLGTEILQHHPNSQLDDFNVLYEQMKNSGVKNYAKICLEHSFHLLLSGNINDAKRQLSVAASWRYGKQSVRQSLDLKLIHAYCGFLDYFIWCMKKSSMSTDEDCSSNREMHSYFRQASVTLQEVITQPGVWDPFVLSYVDMLEFYNDQDEALKVLQNYAYNKDYPSNPNAHVYLYQFLKRHEAPPAKLISTLKVLHHLVPSHELMLEYCSLLLTSVQEDLEESLTVVFNLLDYPSWKYDLNTWNCLLKVMTIFKTKGLQHLIDKEWEKRKDLWLSMHFRECHGRKESEENTELLLVKAKVAKRLGQHGRSYNKFNTEVWGRCNVKEKKQQVCKKRSKKKPNSI
ncbi:TATA box-binding protein-associated factor RNA polymerase I subunit A isoform X2 [Salminus brasiliensis]|uniref:TATA box-binding protein-associated factor RNA polymerase I subunit A isoform X2 n=1 Tax=Salminus brasiliensis TaxID=930266 RepID=UPI003B831849